MKQQQLQVTAAAQQRGRSSSPGTICSEGMAGSRQLKLVPPCPAGQPWLSIRRILSCHALLPYAPLPCPSTSCQTRPTIVLHCSHLIVRLEHEHGDSHHKGAQVQHDLVHERVRVLLTEGVEKVAAQEVEHDAVWECEEEEAQGWAGCKQEQDCRLFISVDSWVGCR